MNELHFFVPGKAQTSGSKRAFVLKGGKNKGRAIIVPASSKQKPWQDAVKWSAMQAFERRIPFEGPLVVQFIFTKSRPKGHYGTGKNEGVIKEWAKALLPTGKPDVLKLGRAVEDAMNSIVYKDDSQIVEEHLYKEYGDKPGVDVRVRKLTS